MLLYFRGKNHTKNNVTSVSNFNFAQYLDHGVAEKISCQAMRVQDQNQYFLKKLILIGQILLKILFFGIKLETLKYSITYFDITYLSNIAFRNAKVIYMSLEIV